jgi:hypothetical protein
MLKKCIVIMVMFALVAGAAFAQITFGGQLQEGMTLFSGNNVIDDPVNMGGTYNATEHEAKFSVLFGDGTAGGRLVWELNNKLMWGWMQWRPSQYFRVKIGKDGDGEWGFPQIIGWGFTGEAKNSVSAVNDYNGTLPMKYRHAGLNYGGFDGNGNFHLGFSVYPVDMLQINFLFRDIDKSAEITERLAKLQISASYKIEEVGTIRFAAVGNGGLAKHKDDGGTVVDGDDVATLHLAFYSNELVQGLAFELGGQYNLPHRNTPELYNNITVAGGINLTMTDPFNMKIRAGGSFGGTTKYEKDAPAANEVAGEEIGLTGFSVGILPSYKLPKMTIFLHAGLGFENKAKWTDTDIGWFINPYIWVPMGGMRMWVGVQVYSQQTYSWDETAKATKENTRDGLFNWNIPFGFNFYF